MALNRLYYGIRWQQTLSVRCHLFLLLLYEILVYL